jgi:citrate lyase subunit beta / citryl-CoA lyase
VRSLLFVSASDETRLAAALEAGADGVCLDLESSVPFAAKLSARKNICAFVAAAKAREQIPCIYVQVNALDTELLDADLDAVLPAGPYGLILPQCADGQSLQHLGAKLAVKEAECGFADGATSIIAGAAATAASIFSMGTFAGASRRLKGLIWSFGSLAAAPGSPASRDLNGCLTAPFALARNLTVFAARAAGVLAIDEISRNSADGDAFRQECEAARRDGFDAKMAINRNQVEIIRAVFAPPHPVV